LVLYKFSKNLMADLNYQLDELIKNESRKIAYRLPIEGGPKLDSIPESMETSMVLSPAKLRQSELE
jgi:hypothetical protein